MKLPPDALRLQDKQVLAAKGTEKLSLVEVIKACAAEGKIPQSLATFKAPFTDPITTHIIRDPVFADFTFSAQAAEVEVDVETGVVTLLKHAAAHDVGRAVNRNRVEGQIEGGAAQGIGYALMEDYLEEQGVPVTWNLHEYLIPTSQDLPDLNAIVLESGSGKGPYGAKGIGEPAITAAAPAVANAIRDALNLRITHIPATPERVFWALQGREGEG
jgi:CO/xanthine dehydrogenase Mo-binding subunit